MFDGLVSEMMGDDPTMSPPTRRRNGRPSALLPTDLEAFEHAAASRPAASPLAPPYDPDESGEQDSAAPRSRQTKPRSTARTTKRLEQVLWAKDRFRLRVMRSHIKWARKQAIKHGLVPEEVNLWQL